MLNIGIECEYHESHTSIYACSWIQNIEITFKKIKEVTIYNTICSFAKHLVAHMSINQILTKGLLKLSLVGS